jgi:hypothetical protein
MIRTPRMLAILLVALVSLALFDRIPDPPTLLQKTTLHRGKATKSGALQRPVRACAFVNCWSFAQPALFTANPEPRIPAVPVLTFVRTAGDSSPPASAIL